ncbi:hypothetical protein H8356DRAFT_1428149 [Neocallimastix lanati (nom. inval.)]|nr:hypothetical protein H8356DRAFT_1428149 [Neocallimastix sp. JGI-2020a]
MSRILKPKECDKNNMKENNDNSTNNGKYHIVIPAKNIFIRKLRSRTTTYVKINLIGQLDNKILDFKDI